MSRAEHLLKDHDLRPTAARLELLDYFLDQNQSLGVSRINHAMSSKFDRATVYRTLKVFTENGILHRVMGLDEESSYALCDSCAEGHHDDEHVHFLCRNCGKNQCLHDVVIPTVALPRGYQLQDANMLLEGLCADCASKN
jgi:Fur family ferric uptake transcriptional regulator